LPRVTNANPERRGEHSTGAILPIEPDQGALLLQLVCSKVPTDSRQSLAEFFEGCARCGRRAKRAEPLIAVSLADNRASTNDFPTLAPCVARGQRRASNRREAAGRSSVWGRARWRAASRVPSISKTTRVLPSRSTRSPVALSCESGRLRRSVRNRERRASTGSWVSAVTKRERVERAGKWSRSHNAHVGHRKGLHCLVEGFQRSFTADSIALRAPRKSR